MKLKRAAFTVVELLVVIAIIAILASFFAPVIRSAKSAVFQMASGRSAKQTLTATSLYMADHDDTYPLAMYVGENGALHTWFGLQTAFGEFDSSKGLLSSYMKGKLGKDSTLQAEPYLGDDTGLGYNYGYLGSDLHIRRDYSNFPNCQNPARGSEIDQPSTTIAFSTSSFYSAPWQEGDGKRYRFGFIDPPSGWDNNPNMDFRHGTAPVVDSKAKVVRHLGRAMVAFADGSTKSKKKPQITDEMFQRIPDQPY